MKFFQQALLSAHFLYSCKSCDNIWARRGMSRALSFVAAIQVGIREVWHNIVLLLSVSVSLRLINPKQAYHFHLKPTSVRSSIAWLDPCNLYPKGDETHRCIS